VLSSSLFASNDFNNIEIIQGDIAVYKRNPYEKAAHNPENKKWKDGLIPWEIKSTDRYNQKLISIVENAINYITRYTNLRFVKRTNEEDYLSFTDTKDGCWSFMGRVGGSQAISLSSGCWYTITAVHEIFHAAGIEHEQCRSDRDEHITINWENIDESVKENFEKVKDSSFRSYNIDSIMHYGSYSFSNNGRPTMVTKDGKIFRENREYLTREDIEGINFMYPAPIGY